MKKFFVFLLALLFISSSAYASSEQSYEAVYLGVKDYGQLEKSENADLKNHIHCFFINGETVELKVYPGEFKEDAYNYPLNNRLQEGYLYEITVSEDMVTDLVLLDERAHVKKIKDDRISFDHASYFIDENTGFYQIEMSAGRSEVLKVPAKKVKGKTVFYTLDGDTVSNVYATFDVEDYTSPVDYTPGEKTLKNFLKTALHPVGAALYIYGGTWDYQDEGSSIQSTTIGIPSSWIDFFQMQDASYSYRDVDGNAELQDPANSYYPYGAWNQYYYAGADCSGYVAWVMYNCLNSVSGGEGFVMGATKMAKSFNGMGLGDYTQDLPMRDGQPFIKPGSIFSMNGHVWISLGTCEDGSIVIVHSTPSDSKLGQPGGGIQISALGSKSSEAYKLAKFYMKKFYPDWSKRYDVVTKDGYLEFKKESAAGLFEWDLLNGPLTDPEGYCDMSPAEILQDIFGE